MATEQVSMNVEQGKGKKPWAGRDRVLEESSRLDTIVDRLIFLKEIFEALGSGGEDYSFSPFAFTGLALIVKSIKEDAGGSLEYVQGIAREMEVSHE